MSTSPNKIQSVAKERRNWDGKGGKEKRDGGGSVSVCMYLCMYACLYVCLSLSVCLSACLYVYMYMCVWVGVCVRVSV